ncbi:MAG: response regulator transcription factor [Planctomycetes bacterium]|nr:response regulator transcription factor [Planctomycetota bacterium]
MSSEQENDLPVSAPAGGPCRVLVADDDEPTLRALTRLLTGWGYEVLPVADGEAAWEGLGGADAPRLALLDWVMPKLDGLDLCRRVREEIAEPPYLILLTGRRSRDDIVAGLDAGADEYLPKPIDPEELRARVRAARRLVELQGRLAERVRELEAALARERRLQGLLPICAWCRKVRNDQNYWQAVEDYLSEHAAVRFTHGICPDCLRSIQDSAARREAPPEETP